MPDDLSALVRKAAATRLRDKDTDHVDLWRCLEVTVAAGIGSADFARDDEADALQRFRQLFDNRAGLGMVAIIGEQRLSERAPTSG